MRAFLLSLALIATPAWAALDLSLPEMGDPASQSITPTEEARIGAALMSELRRRVALVSDPAVNAYVRDLGSRLATHSEAAAADYHFFVVENPHINAFAMPGGYIGVHSGLILAARSESQLASVIAHELAHVTQRHIARRLHASRDISLRTMALILAGILVGTQNPEAGSAAVISGMAGSAQQQLAYSREYEREADRIGMRILADADFDPAGMPQFFERLLEESRYSMEPLPFLSSHPVTRARIADSRARSEDMSPGKVFESHAFGLIRARLAVLQAKDLDDAVNRFRNLASQAKAKPADRYGLAIALLQRDQVEQARSILQDLLAQDGQYALYYLALGEVAQAAGNPAAAAATYREALTLFPGDYALQFRLIEALIDADQPQQALQVSANALQQAEFDAALWRLRASAASAAGNEAEATIAMAHHYHALGDFRSALDQIERVADSSAADQYQRSRATALLDRWRSEMKARQALENG